MKHTFIGNTLEGLTDMEIGILQVALTHLIEDLQDEDDQMDGHSEYNLDTRLDSAKQLYLDLGGREFWK
tara:strand:- start:434 stop:640 length:207 start_codon:yes stop_codon:yes gene_type:complete